MFVDFELIRLGVLNYAWQSEISKENLPEKDNDEDISWR